jgi:hypothetical protein
MNRKPLENAELLGLPLENANCLGRRPRNVINIAGFAAFTNLTMLFKALMTVVPPSVTVDMLGQTDGRTA